jgi:hypothetical protein
MVNKENKNSDKTVLVTMLSGLFSGSIGKLITHPIDTIKAKIQINSGKNIGIIDIVENTLKSESYKGFYKGLPVSVIGSMPACLLYFGSYEYAKKNLLIYKNFNQSEFLTYFIAGIFAEAVSCIIFVPVDVIKERRQVQSNLRSYNYKNDLDALFTILKQEKLKGIYKAYGATVLSFGPMSAFYFMFYEYFKGFFVRNDAKTYIKRVNKEEIQKLKELKLDINFSESLIASAMAGALSSFITNPLDLVKLRMQVERTYAANSLSNFHYKNLFHGLILIAKTEGLYGLFKGALPRILYNSSQTAISMSVLETAKPYIRKILKEEI